MNKGIVLYLFALGLAILSVWQSATLPWLLPVALMGVLPAGALRLWRVSGRKWSELGLGRLSEKKGKFAKGVITGLIVPQLVTVLLFAMGILVFVTDTWPVSLVAGVANGILVGTVKIAIIVFIEEIVFRGFFIQYLGTNVRQSVLLSSLLFGMAHIPTMVNSGVRTPFLLIGVVNFSALGIALGVGFVKTGNSLALPLGLHLGYNLGYSSIVFVVSAVTRQPLAIRYIAPAWLVGQSSWSPETGLIGILVMSALIGCVLVLMPKQSP